MDALPGRSYDESSLRALRGGFRILSLEEIRVSNTRSTTTARAVTVTERRELQRALARVDLSREEELVLRLRHGVPAERTTPLAYRGQDDPELSAKLAMIEADLLDQLRPVAAAEPVAPGGDALKQAIIDGLKKL